MGKTGTSSALGATRATHFCSSGRPACCHLAVRMMVSELIPLASTPLSTVTSGATPPGMTVESHYDITDGRVVTSREECWRRLTSSTAGSLTTVYPFEQLRYGK